MGHTSSAQKSITTGVASERSSYLGLERRLGHIDNW
jgi:hypothetical protein